MAWLVHQGVYRGLKLMTQRRQGVMSWRGRGPVRILSAKRTYGPLQRRPGRTPAIGWIFTGVTDKRSTHSQGTCVSGRTRRVSLMTCYIILDCFKDFAVWCIWGSGLVPEDDNRGKNSKGNFPCVFQGLFNRKYVLLPATETKCS